MFEAAPRGAPHGWRFVAATIAVLAVLLGWLACEGAPYRSPAGDLSEYLDNAFRRWQGDRPYVDFWLLFPPAEVELPAFALEATDGDLNAVLWLNAAAGAAIGAVAFALGWRLGGGPIGGGLLALFLFANGPPAFKAGGYGYGHWYLLLSLLAFGALGRASDRRSLRWLAAAAAFLGLGLLFRVFIVGAAGLAALGALWLGARSRRGPPFSQAVLALAAAPLAAAVVAAVIAGPATPRMARELLVESIDHATTDRGEAFRLHARPAAVLEALGAAANDAPGTRPRLARAVDEGIHLLVLVAAVPLWLLARRRLDDPGIVAIADASSVWGVLMLVRVAGRADLPHLVTATAPLALALAASGGAFVRERRWWLAAPVVLIAAIGLRPAAARLLELPQRLDDHGHTVVARHGAFELGSAARAAEIGRVLELIEARSAPGDPVFVAAFSTPPLYAWTGRRNPTAHDSVIEPLFRPHAAIPDLCRDLARDTPRLVVLEPGVHLGEGLTFESRAPALLAVLDRDFVELETVGRYRVLIPRNPALG